MRTRNTGLVDLRLTDEDIILTPRRLWKVWSLCHERRIPRAAIVSAHTSRDPAKEVPARLRAPGLATLTALAGYMQGSKGRSWWCHRYGEAALILRVSLPKLSYIVVTLDESESVARELQGLRESQQVPLA